MAVEFKGGNSFAVSSTLEIKTEVKLAELDSTWLSIRLMIPCQNGITEISSTSSTIA